MLFCLAAFRRDRSRSALRVLSGDLEGAGRGGQNGEYFSATNSSHRENVWVSARQTFRASVSSVGVQTAAPQVALGRRFVDSYTQTDNMEEAQQLSNSNIGISNHTDGSPGAVPARDVDIEQGEGSVPVFRQYQAGDTHSSIHTAHSPTNTAESPHTPSSTLPDSDRSPGQQSPALNPVPGNVSIHTLYSSPFVHVDPVEAQRPQSPEPVAVSTPRVRHSPQPGQPPLRLWPVFEEASTINAPGQQAPALKVSSHTSCSSGSVDPTDAQRPPSPEPVAVSTPRVRHSPQPGMRPLRLWPVLREVSSIHAQQEEGAGEIEQEGAGEIEQEGTGEIEQEGGEVGGEEEGEVLQQEGVDMGRDVVEQEGEIVVVEQDGRDVVEQEGGEVEREVVEEVGGEVVQQEGGEVGGEVVEEEGGEVLEQEGEQDMEGIVEGEVGRGVDMVEGVGGGGGGVGDDRRDGLENLPPPAQQDRQHRRSNRIRRPPDRYTSIDYRTDGYFRRLERDRRRRGRQHAQNNG